MSACQHYVIVSLVLEVITLNQLAEGNRAERGEHKEGGEQTNGWQTVDKNRGKFHRDSKLRRKGNVLIKEEVIRFGNDKPRINRKTISGPGHLREHGSCSECRIHEIRFPLQPSFPSDFIFPDAFSCFPWISDSKILGSVYAFCFEHLRDTSYTMARSRRWMAIRHFSAMVDPFAYQINRLIDQMVMFTFYLPQISWWKIWNLQPS